MIEQEQNPHVCFECDSEFVVHTPYNDDQPISFCPFCGSEVESEEDDDDDEYDDNLDDDRF
jgi:rRNA maturation endonuclease Nob1